VEPSFQQHFVEAMAIPHKTAAYPNLSRVVRLPEAKTVAPEDVSQSRNRRGRLRSRTRAEGST
jgi:uncharacterized 2Fe-2S/4Fe-4S cluster protein (DUF4445 family)